MWVKYHDCIDTGELSEEDHDIGVDDSTARTRLREEIHPWEAVCATSSNLGLLLFGADLHDKELLASFMGRDTANAAPDLVCLKWFALVHKESRRLRHEENADAHDRREDERAPENVTPATFDSDEHGGYSISENFTEGDVELVEGHQITTKPRLYTLGDVYWDCTAFETDTGTEDHAGCDDHAIVDGAGLKSTTDGVEDTGDEDGPTTTEVFVTWRDENSTSDSYIQLAHAHIESEK